MLAPVSTGPFRIIPVVPAKNARRLKPVCQCAAYAFPHRPGSGKCTDPGPAPKSCSECYHVHALKDAFGIGDYWNVEYECTRDDGCLWPDSAFM